MAGDRVISLEASCKCHAVQLNVRYIDRRSAKNLATDIDGVSICHHVIYA